MIVLSARSVEKYFGADQVLKGINLDLKQGQRLAMLGPNGSGKTTLLRILAGDMEADAGRVVVAKNCRRGYQSQIFSFTAGNTVLEEALSVFAHLVKMEEEIRSLERQMATATAEQRPALLERYSALNQQFEDKGGYQYPARTRSILSGLGFDQQDFSQPVEVLSGGQQSRLALARLLLANPDVLLLDEPTNHLDIQGIHWLEDYLQNYKGTLLMVSHDRRFLQALANSICELTPNGLEHYSGGYDSYRRQRRQRREQLRKEYLAQQEYIKKTEDFIARNIAGQKTKLAQSRRRELEKLDRLPPPPGEYTKASFSFGQRRPSGRQVLEIRDLAMEFDGRPVFENISLTVQRGERLALIGPNGCGKTTLLEIICGLQQPIAGKVKYGHYVETAYYSQKRDDLDPGKSAADEIWEMRPLWTRGEVQSLLARFLFRGEEAFQLVKNMSGGEASRLALAKLLLQEANFLVLDEPTNHLDIDSKEVLEDALDQYPGTVLVVSHDRWFLNKVTGVTLEMSSEGIRRYLGNYDYWLMKKQAEQQDQPEQEEKKQPASATKSKGLSPNEIYRRRQRLAELEREIDSLEETQQQLEQKIRDTTGHQQMAELTEKMQQANQQLDELYREWTAIGEELEQHRY